MGSPLTVYSTITLGQPEPALTMSSIKKCDLYSEIERKTASAPRPGLDDGSMSVCVLQIYLSTMSSLKFDGAWLLKILQVRRKFLNSKMDLPSR